MSLASEFFQYSNYFCHQTSILSAIRSFQDQDRYFCEVEQYGLSSSCPRQARSVERSAKYWLLRGYSLLWYLRWYLSDSRIAGCWIRANFCSTCQTLKRRSPWLSLCSSRPSRSAEFYVLKNSYLKSSLLPYFCYKNFIDWLRNTYY